MRQRQSGHRKRLHGSSCLSPDQQLAAIEALDPDPRERPQRKRKDLPREADEAKQSAEWVSR